MSAREWKPGDVALIQWDGDTEMLAVRVASSCPIAGHANAGHWHTARGTHGQFPDHARPLVVIDPEDREDVARVQDACWRGGNLDDWQDYLRNLADPKPPKPEEPTGLGAVVEDAHGLHWVRVASARTNVDRCWAEATGSVVDRAFDSLDVVRILSHGYDPEATS